MKKLRVKIVILIVLTAFSLTGCWDLVEINKRALIAAIALDIKGENIAITYNVPNLPVLTGQGDGQKVFIKKTMGKTFLETNKNFNKISNVRLSFEHNNVVVFGNEFLQDDQKVKSALDYFDRSSEYSMSLTLIATDKTGEELLESKPNSGDPIGVYIHAMFQPSNGKVISIEKVSLNDFISMLSDTNGNGRLPRVIYKDKEVQMDGIVLLKDYKMCYSLDFDQLIPFDWVQGKGEDTFVEVEYEDAKLTYEISQMTREIKVSDTKNGLEIHISIETEGDVDEYVMEEGKDVFKNKIIEELEKLIKDEMEEKMLEMVRLMQTEVGYDVFNISGRIKLQYGKIWMKIKDDWDAYFSSAKISIEVDPHIRRIGMSK